MPKVGEKAPNFNVLNQSRERFFLSKALNNGKILLVFYPGDDAPTTVPQLSDYRDHLEDFKKLGVQIFPISISTNESQAQLHQELQLPFPLLADYDYRVTHKYGVMNFTGHPKGALFLIDEDQVILYKHVEGMSIFWRNSEDLLEELKKVCPPPPVPEKSAPTTETAAANP